jgi:type I restriction enzyme R subunit
MATNFEFLKSEWPDAFAAAKQSEALANTDPRTACFHARRTLEIAVDWIYKVDEDLTLPYDNQLSTKIFDTEFKNNTPPGVFTKIDYIRRIGNKAVHTQKQITTLESVQAVRELFHFLYWMARTYTQGEASQFDGLQFADANVQSKQVSISANTFRKLKTLYEEAEAKKVEEAEKQKQKATPTTDAELERLRKAVAAAKKHNEKYPDSHNYSEAETRKHIIDLLLSEAGWTIGKDVTEELEVAGMPNNEGVGYVDYVLFGADGKPLAVVEAKKTSVDVTVGKNQAKLYADCLEAKYCRRPVVFYTNGYESHLWDDTGYPPRHVQGFYAKDELELMIQRRETRKPLNENDIDRSIVERHYQTHAITRMAEHFTAKQRKGLLVMATGAGKTRTVIALCDLLMRAGWVKRVLFLADRVALVKQAANAFKAHLPNSNPVNLLKEKGEFGSRVYLSTYPTMMNLINDMDGEERRFGVGYFDIVIVDEAHRSIYQKYSSIFTYFDSFLVGLTATPKGEVDKNTYRMFDLQTGVPTDAYELDVAVKDGFLVPSVNVAVPTKFIREGITYDELSEDEKTQWDEIEWNEEGEVPDHIDPAALNNWLFNIDTIDKVLKFLMEAGLKVEGGDKLGKTIIFAKNRRHAALITERFDLNYPHLKGQFAATIDYKTTYSQDLLDNFSTPAKLPQIAVSIDMLDTGIDIPEILNLVFFKAVRSKTKFTQMIGRGTRLRLNLFAPGADKQFFYIFDYCQNFEYFNQQVTEVESPTQKTLSEKLFEKRVEIIDTIRQKQDGDLSGLESDLLEHLQKTVELINLDNFVVRPHRREVEKFRDQKAWEKIDPESFYELTHIVAGLPNEQDPEDETAKRFDLLMFKLMLTVLSPHRDFEKFRDQVIEIANQLEEKDTIPMVVAEMELIQELQRDEYWRDVTVPMLENVRRKIRDLVKFIDANKRQIIYTDFEDELGTPKEIAYGPSVTDLTRYKTKVMNFLKNEENHIVLQKLRRNKPITSSDIAELERIFFESGELGSREEFENAFGKQDKLGLFIRSLAGLDRHEAKLEFADFLDGHRYNANQIEFVNMIVDHLTQNGVMEPAILFESPYTNYDPSGLSGLFADGDASRIVDILSTIKRNAAAA